MSEYQDIPTLTTASTVDVPSSSSSLSLLVESSAKVLQNLKLRALLACRLTCRTLKRRFSAWPPSPMSDHQDIPAPTTASTVDVHSRLLSLPVELSTKVLQNLDLLALLACRLTCRTLKTLVDSSPSLQYQVALSRVGMRDNPYSAHTTNERIKSLAEYTDAWKHLRWTEHTVLTSESEAIRVWAVYDSIAAFVSNGRIVFHQLPSRLREIAAKRWEVVFPFRVEDFGFEPLQDVLIVLERDLQHVGHTLHVRSLSTGDDHPLSRKPWLPMLPFDGLPGNNDEPALELKYSLRFGSGDYYWKSGVTIWTNSSPSVRDFTFLSGERCLVGVLSGWKLPIRPQLDVWLLCKNEEAYVCSSFQFPPLSRAEDLVLDFSICRSTPCDPLSPSNRTAPFALDHEAQFQLLSVVYIMKSGGNIVMAFPLFIRLSALLKFVEMDVAQQPVASRYARLLAWLSSKVYPRQEQPHEHGWAYWAKDVVRVSTIGFGSLCGSRSAQYMTVSAPSLRDGGGSMAEFVAVDDFHPYRLSRVRHNPFMTFVRRVIRCILRRDQHVDPNISDYVKHLIRSVGDQLPLDVTLAELPPALQNTSRLLQCQMRATYLRL
ncbi:hypothetical protein FA95DRAFT_1572778 [Auriscalpium vulgare]|uniref:Uncharacterized protein n=1 Tax=Auriscalpium vulgare TaxID=40419 RepID=A0ACB8RSF6_9AGAM|nr:hypothetical protein FA95DRAFT_1572778 [Auriscalpium vulgare]